MTHPLVTQLRFTRGELLRCLEGISDEDAKKRLPPLNCISWIIGHLASQENAYWVYLAQDEKLYPELRELVGFGKPPSTPPLDQMWETWRTITSTADRYLDNLTVETLWTHFEHDGKQLDENIGTMLYRNIYHIWFHLGEAHAIRQTLGHEQLPEFVGDMSDSFYQPEK
jgi:hypothetical protein